MRLDALPFLPAGLTGAAIAPAWRTPLARLGLVWLGLLAVFFGDWAAMADQWWNSSTYTHILLIPAIVAWLVLQRAGELARLTPSGWWPGLALFGLGGFGWLLGEFAGINVVSQFAVVGMGIAAALALLGPRVGVALAFPLAYLFFLVPFGDELVPPMQMITAKITIWLVNLSNVPAVIDGVFIDTPAGLFEVAEACSGVKFLIAMIAFGVLAAQVCFLDWRRRTAFLALCLALPILANGVRAWGTIYIAQIRGAEYAAGFDHIVYGWLFFAVVIAAVIALAWRFFDRPLDAPVIDPEALLASPLLARLEAMRIGPVAAVAIMAATMLGYAGWARAADGLRAPLSRQVFLPEAQGWRRIDYAPRVWWEPRAAGADHRLLGRYADGKGHEVDVFVAVYASQGEGREAGGIGEGAFPAGDWSWQGAGPAVDGARSDRLLAHGPLLRLAQTTYRNGDLATGGNLALRLATMRDRLLLRERPTMTLILSAEERPGAPAAASIAAFRRTIGAPGPWMDRIGGID